MKTQLIATAALLAAFTATSASAITHKSGVIKSVDLVSNTVVLTLNSGRDREYRLTADSRVVIDGKQETVKSLTPRQEVTVAIPSSAPEYVRAKILEMDHATGLALVKPMGSKETITIRVAETTKIGGKITSKEELSEGQTIKIRYVANI
jgi:hypothetical protein